MARSWFEKMVFKHFSEKFGKKHLSGKQSNKMCELVILCPHGHLTEETYFVLKAFNFSLKNTEIKCL